MKKLLLYIISGINELVLYHRWKWAFIATYSGFALYCLYMFENPFDMSTFIRSALATGTETVVTILWVVGFFFVLAAIGRPFGSFFIKRRIRRTGFTNSLGQYPMLVSRRKDKNKEYGLIYKFANVGIDLETFERKASALGQCLKANVRYYELSKNAAYTSVYVTPRKHDKPSIISNTSDFLTRGLINLLCVGNTGSGKSVAMGVILASIVRLTPDISITICDYKKSSFAHFEDEPNFYGYEDVPDGIRAFYREFQERLEANDEHRNNQKRVLCIDEYGALIAAQDKKQADELKMMVANMLFMSRSLGLILIVGVQRADAEHFKAGARDQFKAILGMGNLSKEQKAMLFVDYKDKMMTNNHVGEGYLLVDGRDIERVKVIPCDMIEKDSIIRQAMHH